MFEIKLSNKNRCGATKWFAKDKGRMGSATSCHFIDDNHIAIANFIAMEIYLYEINIED